MHSVALPRLEGHNRSPERSSSSSRMKRKGSAKLTGREERDGPSSRGEKPDETKARMEQSRVDQKVDRKIEQTQSKISSPPP